jgi:acyl dehydratase
MVGQRAPGREKGNRVRIFGSVDELSGAVGEQLGHSEWHEVTQDQVQLFADATGDHQWIHLDAERAAAGPFGTTIAHGYLTLSLLPVLTAEVYRVDGVRMGVNYGLNKVRFPSVVPVGSRLRASVRLTDVAARSNGVQVTFVVTIEREGGDAPVCVAEALALLVP